MALKLQFSDSFDHYDYSQIGKKWDSIQDMFIGGTGLVSGRTGSALSNIGTFNFFRKTVALPAQESGSLIIVLAAFRLLNTGQPDPYPTQPIISLMSGGPEIAGVRVEPDGTLALSARNGTTGRVTAPLLREVWYMLQLACVITEIPVSGGSDMSIVARMIIDEPVSSRSGRWDTSAIGSVPNGEGTGHRIDIVNLAADGGKYDDLSIFTDLDLPPATAIEDLMIDRYDQRVLAREPNADGADLDFVPGGGGSHYAEVDEVPPDDDTTYNQSANFGEKDTYGAPNVPAIGTGGLILGVQNVLYARGRNTGSPTPDSPSDGITGFDAVSGVLRISSADHVTRMKPLRYDDYRFYGFPTTYNPDTGLLYTRSELNAAEWGLAHESTYFGAGEDF